MPNRDKESTLAKRINAAMAAAGIKTPAELARKMKTNRQTVHRWVNEEGNKLTPKHLYALSDVLNVNARWLALGPPNSPGKPIFTNPDESEVIAIYRNLSPKARDQWMSQGRGLLALLSPTGIANPFPSKV